MNAPTKAETPDRIVITIPGSTALYLMSAPFGSADPPELHGTPVSFEGREDGRSSSSRIALRGKPAPSDLLCSGSLWRGNNPRPYIFSYTPPDPHRSQTSSPPMH